MVSPDLCQTAFTLLRQIEPIIVLEQLGSSLFDTALKMVVKDRCENATYPDTHLTREESQQKAMTDFYMYFNLITKFTPVLPALILARLGDRGWRRVPIILPLAGYLLSRLVLLLVVIFRLPLEVMFGSAVLYGVFGGFCAYWPGVLTLASLGSAVADRSKMMMRVELLYGTSGLMGSLVSGHLFLLYSPTLGHGTVLLTASTLLHLLCFLHSICLLQVKEETKNGTEEECHLISPDCSNGPVEGPFVINKVNVALLFVAAVLYLCAVGGAIEILGVFVLKEPLSWTATQVGYGNAAGCVIFITSYLGVMVFRCCISDVMLILIGMMSFAFGIYFMSFVTTSLTFYLARSLNLFALIPLPTIRSLLSFQVPAASCGTTLTILQLALKFVGLAYIPAFTKIYQATLDWFPGFVFILAAVFTVLGMIPISVFGCRLPQRQRYERIPQQ